MSVLKWVRSPCCIACMFTVVSLSIPACGGWATFPWWSQGWDNCHEAANLVSLECSWRRCQSSLWSWGTLPVVAELLFLGDCRGETTAMRQPSWLLSSAAGDGVFHHCGAGEPCLWWLSYFSLVIPGWDKCHEAAKLVSLECSWSAELGNPASGDGHWRLHFQLKLWT
jgi:hypothetical protein